MKIAFFETEKWEERYLKKALKGNQLKFYKETFEYKSEIKDIDALSVFIYSKLDKNLKSFSKLRMIATRSTGFDHINLDICKHKKISIHNVPSYGENTVAEHTLGLILSLSRNIHKSYVRTMKNDFSIKGLKGFDLNSKTIGIIGGGKIGMHVARMTRAFGMKVLVYDINHNNFLSEVLDFTYTDLDLLLNKSDIISLHVPHNEKTHHMINKSNLKKIKKGAILINTSRGQLVDTDALLYALEKNIISGAGLDVIEGEELIKEEEELIHNNVNPSKIKNLFRAHKIFKMENVVFTPHNAFNSKEALIRILDVTIKNLRDKTNKIKSD